MKSASRKKLLNAVAAKLNTGIDLSVDILKYNTPIDTQRLYESTRNGGIEINYRQNQVLAQILIGGIELYGVRREQNLLKPVNYGLWIEIKYSYIRSSLSEMIQAIISCF